MAQQRNDGKARFNSAQCNITAAVNKIEVVAANERAMVAEITYGELDFAAATKSRIAFGASANAVTADGAYRAAVKALDDLCAHPSPTTTAPTTKSPPSPPSPQAATTAIITPNTVGTIILGNHYVRASSLLWAEMETAIRELQTNPLGDLAMVEARETNPTVIGRRIIVLDGLRKLV